MGERVLVVGRWLIDEREGDDLLVWFEVLNLDVVEIYCWIAECMS